ncbi:RING finger protein 222 [Salarias fasciatus]|uniref:RING finger protein 222 n=1 Tax=Salarias fasciatus TaxID=181472 RepID=UPI001176B705|nr:RING finger protein 222 [Salarias fasciatus]
MEMYQDENHQDAHECPVCYESLQGTERTLSCGHVFCHDCLVKTLVGIHSDGNIRETIACPICRHLTFIKRQKESLLSLVAEKDAGEGQTLEVPVPLPPEQLQGARRASGNPRRNGLSWIPRCLRGISQRVRRQRLVSPGHNASQIFIISAQGRPMAEEDSFSVVMTVVHPQRRRRRRVCSTAQCLLVLLSAFTILALVAVILPWILLA